MNKKELVSSNNIGKKIPVECYTRVVGYFRPVQQWNNGKQEEFSQRKNLRIKKNEML